jgi:hypothetical protein
VIDTLVSYFGYAKLYLVLMFAIAVELLYIAIFISFKE